jgi:hypothetical protein
MSDNYGALLKLKANRIKEIEAERDALAGQNVQMRKALTNLHHSASPPSYMDNDYIGVGQKTPMEYYEEDQQKAAYCLALPLPAAAAQVAEWKEKAAKWDEMNKQPASRFDHMRNERGETLDEVAKRWDDEALRAAKEAGDGK